MCNYMWVVLQYGYVGCVDNKLILLFVFTMLVIVYNRLSFIVLFEKDLLLLKFTQFEHMPCRVIIQFLNIDIVIFYRPPTSPQNGLTTTAFLDEWSTFMSQLIICKSELIVVGDVNIHLDNQTLHHTVEFIQSL